MSYNSGTCIKISRLRAGSRENVSPQIFLLGEYVSEEKMCLKRILQREHVSEEKYNKA